MAQERHTKAFVVGTLLGGAAGAVAALWRVPRSGAETRASINSAVENAIFKALGMDEREGFPTTPAPRESGPANLVGVAPEPTPVEPQPFVPVVPREEPVTIPSTFRGEPIADSKPEFQR